MSLPVSTARLLLLCSAALMPLPCLAIPAEEMPSQNLRLNEADARELYSGSSIRRGVRMIWF